VAPFEGLQSLPGGQLLGAGGAAAIAVKRMMDGNK
jgi:hypothetical protein